jgi:uncharacterized protein (TIGR03067 family)
VRRFASILSLLLPTFVQAQTSSDLDQLQGDWQIVAMFQSSAESMQEPKYRGSAIEIAKNRFHWKGADGLTMLDGTFKLRPAMQKGASSEMPITMAWNGMPAREFQGYYVLEKNHLRLSIRVKDPKPKSVVVQRPSTRPDFLTFILERGKGPLGKTTGAKDTDRIVGSWDVVAHFDDGDDYTTRGRYVSITKDRLEWKTNANAKGVNVGADYKLHPEKAPPCIDFLNTKGGNPPPPQDGFLPSIYRFVDDDTLLISWPESGWKKDAKPEDRPRPKFITSDGDINLFVLRRRT